MDEKEIQAGIEAAENTENTAEQIEEQVPAAEKTEETAAQSEKVYTEAEFNSRLDELLSKKIARRESKIRREYDRKYGELESVLRAGTGKDSVEEMTGNLRQFYGDRGVNLSERSQAPQYSEKDTEILARAEAEEIIEAGGDEVSEELDRLASIGVKNMTARERLVFKTLAAHREEAERGRELSRMGVDQKVYGSKEFRSFAAKFNSGVPAAEIYSLYTGRTKQESASPIGSLKNGSQREEKTYYTPEEVDKLTEKDLDDPVIFRRVRESMKAWK